MGRGKVIGGGIKKRGVGDASGEESSERQEGMRTERVVGEER